MGVWARESSANGVGDGVARRVVVFACAWVFAGRWACGARGPWFVPGTARPVDACLCWCFLSFFRVVVFRVCGFSARWRGFLVFRLFLFAARSGERLGPFRPFVLSKFLLRLLGFVALVGFPRVIIDER